MQQTWQSASELRELEGREPDWDWVGGGSGQDKGHSFLPEVTPKVPSTLPPDAVPWLRGQGVGALFPGHRLSQRNNKM